VEQIDTRKDPNDAARLKNTQELIEEKILPLITNLSNDEAIKAQTILQLSA
jgi:hypothetical protein